VAGDLESDRAQAPWSGLAGAAIIVAAGFLGSRLLGVVRSVAIAGNFGTSPELGAYWVGFRLPDLIFQLLTGATLASAFIPTFVRQFTHRGEEEAWRLASSVLNLVAGATLVLALLGMLLAPVLVPIMAPGLGEDVGREAELRSLAVDLTRIMLLSTIFFSISGMFMGILNARRHFLYPAVAPMVYNLSIIVAALVSHNVRVLAIGVVVGALLHLLVQLPALRQVGMRYNPIARWRDPAVREVGRLMLPRVLGLAAWQFNFLITVFFASTISDAAISAANYSWLIVMTPLGIFGMAIATALFPTLADQAAQERSEEMRWAVSNSLRLILFLTLPASLGLMLLGQPLVTFLFQRGEFGTLSTDITASALVFYSIGLFALGGTEILSRGFYALGDTRTPVAFAVLSMVLNLIFCLILVVALPLEVRGLALSLSLASIVEFFLLFRTLSRRMGGLDEGRVVYSLIRMAGAALLMVEVVGLFVLLLHASGHLNTGHFSDAFATLAGGGLIGAGTYFLAAYLLGSDELGTLMRRIPALRLSRG
jgi:putative peptidoglycan lipid II flippase